MLDFHLFVIVTLPAGVNAGDTIHVQAPDGRKNAIVVPPGMGPGSTFTVEFSGEPAAAPAAQAAAISAVPSTAPFAPSNKLDDIGMEKAETIYAPAQAVNDDFVSGFPQATASAYPTK